MKKTLEDFFKKKYKLFNEKNIFLFKYPYDTSINSFIYQGNIDEEEYILWKPQEKKEIHRLDNLQKIIGTEIHQDLLDYVNSFWFLKLSGFYKNEEINLIPIIPTKLGFQFEEEVIYYKKNINLKNNFIYIGTIDEIDYILFDNETGKVYRFYFERNKVELLSNSLKKFISEINVLYKADYEYEDD